MINLCTDQDHKYTDLGSAPISISGRCNPLIQFFVLFLYCYTCKFPYLVSDWIGLSRAMSMSLLQVRCTGTPIITMAFAGLMGTSWLVRSALVGCHSFLPQGLSFSLSLLVQRISMASSHAPTQVCSTSFLMHLLSCFSSIQHTYLVCTRWKKISTVVI